MTSITQENPIGGPQLKFIKPYLLENKAPTTKSPKMAHSRSSPVHDHIAHLVQGGPQKNQVPNMAISIHRFRPIFSQSPMLVEHHPSHLTKGTIFPLNYTILTVANMASYAISSSLILVIHDNMIIGTNLIVLACLCRHF
jgi:hypothetical protein